MTFREADYPYGRAIDLGDGLPWSVVMTKPIEGEPAECPFMVLVRQAGTDPHPCDWWPVSSLERQTA